MAHFDLLVIGSGPGGQRAAIQAAKLKKRVGIVEGRKMGGACLHFGTIPSKTLREAALGLDSSDPKIFQKVQQRAREVIAGEETVIQHQLTRNGVEIFFGWAEFESSHSIVVKSSDQNLKLTADSFVIATGNRPLRPAGVNFRAPLYDSDTILGLQEKPKTLAVIGAGVIGSEYASIFATLGVTVSLFDRRKELLRTLDTEISGVLRDSFATLKIQMRLGEPFEILQQGDSIELKTPRGHESFDAILYCLGRASNTEQLKLEKAGLKLDDKGLFEVGKCYETKVPHIYAVGDVQGAPGLATSASEQGRMAAASIFGAYCGLFPSTFPYGIYTIPEISCVGQTEEQLRLGQKSFVVGRARYKELARGKILGDETGLLKLLVDRETQKILGVHALGTQATELIHIGQVAMALGADLNFFVSNVFNYPTLAEAYKVAAYQAFNEISKTA
jgi:NAD(P) transhydrogenase